MDIFCSLIKTSMDNNFFKELNINIFLSQILIFWIFYSLELEKILYMLSFLKKLIICVLEM